MVLKPKAKPDRPSERDSRSNQADSSSSNRGGSHYQPRDNQRRDRGSVHFSEREDSSSSGGTSQLSTTMTHPSCNCDDTDVGTTYRMCCITVGNSPSLSAATLFDTGAHTSFVNRDVAAWIERQAKGDKGYAKRRGLGPETVVAWVSLAGTSHTSAILGSVVFDLTFLNEVTQSHETIRNIHAQVLDSHHQ